MKKWTIRLYIISFVLIFCSITAHVIAFSNKINPTFSNVQSIRILRIEKEEAFISLVVEVNNHSLLPFSIINTDLYIYDTSKQLGSVIVQNNVFVPGNSSSIAKFQLLMEKEKMVELLKMNQGSMKVQIQGTCILRILGIRKDVTLNEVLELKLDQMMEEYVFRIFQNSVFVSEHQFDQLINPKNSLFTLKFRNDSGFDVSVNSLKSKLSINQIYAGSSNLSNFLILEKDAIDIEESLVFDLSSLNSLQYSNPLQSENKKNYSIESMMNLFLINRNYNVKIELNGAL